MLFAEGGRVLSQASCCIWRMALCLRSAAFNLMMATSCSQRAAFYILRAIRCLQRTATLRGRHHTYGGRRVVRRGRQGRVEWGSEPTLREICSVLFISKLGAFIRFSP